MSGWRVLETTKAALKFRVLRGHRASRLTSLTAVCLLLGLWSSTPGARTRRPAPAFTLDQVLSYPFPEHLVASPAGARVAWTFNERGVRNIYTAAAPEFAA